MIYFITGGSRGIGANIVEEAVRAGHDVAFTYNHNEAKAQQVIEKAKSLREGAVVRAYQMDVRDRPRVDDVLDQAANDFDTIDGTLVAHTSDAYSWRPRRHGSPR